MEEKNKPIVTSRILFISVLEKILFWGLIISFIVLSIFVFSGDIKSNSYDYFEKLFIEAQLTIFYLILFLFLNWFYKCAAQTMLCVTENQVYSEIYFPLIEMKTSIPFNKITSVTTYDFFWIFRCVIIFQYHKLPLIFFTWTNKEFKNALNSKLKLDEKEIENDFEDKNIINKKELKFVKIVAIIMAIIIALLGILRIFFYFNSVERRILGTYVCGDKKIVLEKDYECDIEGIEEKTEFDCTWSYNEKTKNVTIRYSVRRYGYYTKYSYDSNEFLELKYEKDTLILEDEVFEKVKK